MHEFIRIAFNKPGVFGAGTLKEIVALFTGYKLNLSEAQRTEFEQYIREFESYLHSKWPEHKALSFDKIMDVISSTHQHALDNLSLHFLAFSNSNNKVNFKYGIVTKDELVNIDTPFIVEEDLLSEDLFLLEEKSLKLGLDVGWYEGDQGKYSIYIIGGYNWDEPLFRKDVFHSEDLEKEFYKALSIFNELCERKIARNE